MIFHLWRMEVTERGALQKPAPGIIRVLELKLTVLELDVEVLSIRRIILHYCFRNLYVEIQIPTNNGQRAVLVDTQDADKGHRTASGV